MKNNGTYATALKELSALRQRLMIEFARGDYAIPALKDALKKGIGNGGDPISIHEIGVSGSAIPSLRGQAKNVRRALGKYWDAPHSMGEATATMQGVRKWAAGALRDARLKS